MTEIVKRDRSRSIYVDYGMADYCEHYNEIHNVKVPNGKYAKIVNEFNTALIDELLEVGDEYVMPILKFVLVFRKLKQRNFIKDGKLKMTAPVDWLTTRNLWNVDPEAKKNKVLVRYNNYHTNGFVFRVVMQRRSKVRNKSAFRFDTNRYLARKLAKRINNQDKDKFDAYLLFIPKNK